MVTLREASAPFSLQAVISPCFKRPPFGETGREMAPQGPASLRAVSWELGASGAGVGGGKRPGLKPPFGFFRGKGSSVTLRFPARTPPPAQPQTRFPGAVE